MSRSMRNRNRVSYFEPEEPSFDDYVFCSKCGDYVYEYCSVHGPLLVIPDDKVPSQSRLPPLPPRAALSLPRAFLHLAPSTIPDAGIGVFSTMALPKGARFGPYRGLKTDKVTSSYCWQILDHNRKPLHTLDARDPNRSNWMRYVNCSRHFSEQNLLAFQYKGQLYYRTIKIIPRFTELLVFYGSEFANELNVDLRRYHSSTHTKTLVKREAQETPDDIPEKKLVRCLSINSEPTNDEELTSQEMQLTDTVLDAKENILQNLDSTELAQKLYNENEFSSEDKIEYNVNCNQSFDQKSFNGSVMQEVATNIKVKKYSCPICKEAFVTKSEFINHDIKVHDSKNNYKACTICEYKTVSNRDLKKHIETHRDIKYKCNICGYETQYLSFLERHQKTHICKHCKRIFKTSTQLYRHVKLHMEDKSYDCSRV